ncbi:MAG: carotenoid oxygenase family protein [Pseudomonadota bacterium]
MADGAGAWTTHNPYLNGNFAPVMDENTFDDLEVEGVIPDALEGAYLRIGSNPVHVKDPDLYHWFDGDGMVHSLAFSRGKARYKNRFMRTHGLALEAEAGHALWGGINSPPDFSNPNGPYKNVANTAIVLHAGAAMALWEGGPPHVFTVPDLETVGPMDYDGKLNHPFSAHPKVDGKTKEMVTFGYGPMGDKPVGVSIVAPDGALKNSTALPLKKPVMMHDFAITANYNVFMDLPMTFDLQRLMGGGQMLDWEPENGARIGVMPRHGDGEEVRWFDIDNCFVFHTATAWEEGDRIVLIACRMQRPILVGSSGAKGDMPENNYTVARWDLDLSTGRATETELFALHGDFPRFNESLAAHKHRYAYMPFNASDQIDFGGLVKLDLEDATYKSFDFGPTTRLSEAVFAARPGASAEDEGWLIAFAHDEATDESSGVIFDAQDVASGPIARIKIPTRIPYGFHAAWAPASTYTG